MGNMDFAVLGKQRGKVGNLVGYVRKGKQFYRAYVEKVAQSKSEKALLAKGRFGVMSKIALAFRGPIARGYHRLLSGSTRTPANLFIKKNTEAFTASEPDEVTCNYGAIVVAEGYLPEVSFKTPNWAVEGKVTVPFDSNSDSVGADGDDKVYLFAYQADTNTGIMSRPVSRSAGSIEMAFPTRMSGMQVHLYGWAQNGDTDRWVENWLANMPAWESSPSTYIGTGTVA